METKEKRVLSPEHLEKLKIAREKALAVRQKKAQEKKLEKELETKKHEQKINGIKEELETMDKPKVIPSPPKPESDTDSDSSIIIKKKTKKKKAKKIVIVEDSDSDEEQQQVIFVKRKKDTPPPAQVQQPILDHPAPAPEPQGRKYIDPTQIYAEHYQRQGFQRRY
jgi:hypothetical protein